MTYIYMEWLNDARLDELRDLDGKLATHIPALDWLQPDRVTLHRLGGTGAIHYSANPFTIRFRGELEFVIQAPWSKRPPGVRLVRPQGEILEGFLGLAMASDEKIRNFAAKYGPLLVLCRRGRRSAALREQHKLVIVESCEVWKYFASCMQSLMRIAAAFHAGRTPNRTDWDTIGDFPQMIEEDDAEREPDLLGHSSSDPEQIWRSIASRVRSRKWRIDESQSLWTWLLNSLLELGRARPWVIWEKAGKEQRPRLVFSGPNLLSYLALQLCLKASKHDSFAVCSHCNKQYSPGKRAPKAGQNHFCPECRADGVPIRVAQRARRQLLRSKLLRTDQ